MRKKLRKLADKFDIALGAITLGVGTLLILGAFLGLLALIEGTHVLTELKWIPIVVVGVIITVAMYLWHELWDRKNS